MKFRPPALLTALFLLWITGSSVCGGTLVRFHTIFGDLMVELFDEEPPRENLLRDRGRRTDQIAEVLTAAGDMASGVYAMEQEVKIKR